MLHVLFIIMQLHRQLVMQVCLGVQERTIDIFHHGHHHDKVVNKAFISAAPGRAPLRHGPVKRRQIEVGQNLRREVPNRQTPVTVGMEQALVVRKVVEEVRVAMYIAVRRRIVAYNFDKCGKHQFQIIILVMIVKKLAEHIDKDSLVYTHKETHEVKASDISVRSVPVAHSEYVVFYCRHGCLCAEPLTAVETHIFLSDEKLFKERIEF